MKVFLVLALFLVNYVVIATTTVRSVMLFATTSSFKGRLMGTNTTTNTNCTSVKPAWCTSSGAFSLLARSDLNLADLPVNKTVPVIWYSTNLTMAATWPGLFTLASGTTAYIWTAVTNVLGSVGQNQTYWTGAGADGRYIDAQSSCGGNWSSNLTGNVGLTGSNDFNWLNYTQTSCELSRPFLCACESFATPLSASNGIGQNTPAVIGGVIAAIVVLAMIIGIAMYIGNSESSARKRAHLRRAESRVMQNDGSQSIEEAGKGVRSY